MNGTRSRVRVSPHVMMRIAPATVTFPVIPYFVVKREPDGDHAVEAAPSPGASEFFGLPRLRANRIRSSAWLSMLLALLGACSGASSTPAAPTAPAAPARVTATAGAGTATVTWTPAKDGGSAITGYTVASSPGNRTAVTTGATQAVVSALAGGIAYQFTVTATNAVGTSAASAFSNSVTPSAQVSAPAAPTAVVATAADAQATVTWTAPADGGEPILQYVVVSSPEGRSATTAGATHAIVAGLTNGLAYSFVVTAANANGTGPASLASRPVIPSGTKSTLISAAGGGSLALSDGTSISIPPGALASDTTIALSNAPSAPAPAQVTAVGPVVLLGPEGTTFSSAATVTLPFDPARLPAGASTSQVRIYTAPAGSSSYVLLGGSLADATHVAARTMHFSVFVAAIAAPQWPARPAAPTAQAGDSQATVSWTPPDDGGSPITGYSITASATGTTVQTDGATTTVTIPLVPDGTAYSFKVAAINAVGSSQDSPFSARVSPSRQATPWADVTAGTGGLRRFASEGPQTRLFGTGPNGVFFSEDSGQTWRPFNTGLPPAALAGVTSIAVVPRFPFPSTASQLYIGVTGTDAASSGVYQTQTNGPNWQPANSGLPVNSTAVTALATLSSSLYLGLTVNNGSTSNCNVSPIQPSLSWSDFDLNSFPLHFFINQFVEFHGLPFAGTFGLGVWALSGPSWVTAGFNGGTAQTEENGNVFAVASDTLFLGTSSHSLQKSATGMNDWVSAAPANFALAEISGLAVVGFRLYMGLSSPTTACTFGCPTLYGVFFSDDLGRTWKMMNAGLPPELTIGVAGLFADDQAVLVQYGGKLYRTTPP